MRKDGKILLCPRKWYYNNYINYLIILVKQTERTIYPFFSITLHSFLGLAVSIPNIGRVDLCSSPKGESNLTRGKRHKVISGIIRIIHFIRIILQVDALHLLLQPLAPELSQYHDGGANPDSGSSKDGQSGE